MQKPARLSRRFPTAMTDAGYRRLKALARDNGLAEGEALSILFENFDRVVQTPQLARRMRLYAAAKDARA